MATTPTSPLPGTSSGRLNDSMESYSIDIGLLVGDDKAEQWSKLLALNKLRIVPDELICAFANDQKRLTKELEEAKLDAEKSQAIAYSLSEEVDRLKSSTQNFEELQLEVANNRSIIDGLQETLSSTCTQMKEHNEKKDETIKSLQDQLQQAQNNIKVNKENFARENAKNLENARTQLNKDFQEERGRRMNEISQLNTDKENERREVFKYKGEIRQLAQISGFVKANSDDLFCQSSLDYLKCHIEDSLKNTAGNPNEIDQLKKDKERMETSMRLLEGMIHHLAEFSGFTSQSGNYLFSATTLDQLKGHIREKLDQKTEEINKLRTCQATLVTGMEELIRRVRENQNGPTTLSVPMEIDDESSTGNVNETSNLEFQTTAAVPPPACGEQNLNLSFTTTPNSENICATTTPPISPNLDSSLKITSVVSIDNKTLPPPQPPSSEPAIVNVPPPPPKCQHLTNNFSPSSTPIVKMVVEVDPYDIEAEFGTSSPATPSIIVPLQQQQEPTRRKRPSSSSMSAPKKGTRGGRRWNSKQMTPFAVTSKTHGVNKASTQFRCLCGNKHRDQKRLTTHIHKMTKEWKYKCGTCLEYFFHREDLNKHLTKSTCAGSIASIQRLSGRVGLNGCNTSTTNADDFVDNLLGVTPPPVATSSSDLNFNAATSKRKLQQAIMKGKQHAPWSKLGAVQGSFYCKCGSKFNSSGNLQYHVRYFNLPWKFKCPEDQCKEKFFRLNPLKRHMMVKHKIPQPLKEYKSGCNLCGDMFTTRNQLNDHQKRVHNMHSKNRALSNIASARRVSTPPKPAASSTPVVIDLSSGDEDDDGEEVVFIQQARPSSSPPPSPSLLDDNFHRPSAASAHTHQPPATNKPINNSTGGTPRAQRHGVLILKREINSQSPSDDHTQNFHMCECSKKYKNKNSLLKHIKIEKYGPMYSCTLCSKRCNEASRVRVHMRVFHHQVYDGFNCALCGKLFLSAKQFSQHRLNEHHQI